MADDVHAGGTAVETTNGEGTVLTLPTSEAEAQPPEADLTAEEMLLLRRMVAAVPPDRELHSWINWLARPEKKIAIVGFTPSRSETPWDDDSFEIWICNNLYKFVPDKWHRLYDLHDDKTIQSDKEHAAYLASCKKPIYCWQPKPEWKTAQAFPKQAVVDAFGRYFTNSISWMTAQAIAEGATEIHIYGVDMAQGGEYAAQRPSCEYFLGFAAGRGCKIHIPQQSDLLKNITLYGAEDDSAFRAKVDAREKELVERMNANRGQYEQVQAQFHQMQGALENTRYFRSVWTNPRGERGTAEVEEALKAAETAAEEKKETVPA